MNTINEATDAKEIFMNSSWCHIGNGSFNKVYRTAPHDSNKNIVVRLPKAANYELEQRVNSVERFARIWQEVNHPLPVKAAPGVRLKFILDRKYLKKPLPNTVYIYFQEEDVFVEGIIGEFMQSNITTQLSNLEYEQLIDTRERVKIGPKKDIIPLPLENKILQILGLDRELCIVPYLDRQASDQESMHKVLDIYRNTRRIIADACGDNNMLKSSATNHVYAVDLDYAIHRDSPVSRDFWDQMNAGFLNYWSMYSRVRPHTTQMIKVLLYLDSQPGLSAEDIDNKYLYPELLKRLRFFHDTGTAITKNTLLFLDLLVHLDIDCSISLSDITPDVLERFSLLPLEEHPRCLEDLRLWLQPSLAVEPARLRASASRRSFFSSFLASINHIFDDNAYQPINHTSGIGYLP